MSESASQSGRETTLFESQGVLVTSDRLVVAGRTWPLAEVEAVESIHRPPRAFPWLLSLLVGMVLGLPALLAVMAAPEAQGRGAYAAALVVAALALFGSIAGLLSIGDTYGLILRTGRSQGQVLRSRDGRLVSCVAAAVAQATTQARQRGSR